MKIEKTGYGKSEVLPVEDFVASQLDGDDYERGRLEAAERTASNACQAIGRLLDLMAEKRIINASDICKIVDSYIDNDSVTTVLYEDTEV